MSEPMPNAIDDETYMTISSIARLPSISCTSHTFDACVDAELVSVGCRVTVVDWYRRDDQESTQCADAVGICAAQRVNDAGVSETAVLLFMIDESEADVKPSLHWLPTIACHRARRSSIFTKPSAVVMVHPSMVLVQDECTIDGLEVDDARLEGVVGKIGEVLSSIAADNSVTIKFHPDVDGTSPMTLSSNCLLPVYADIADMPSLLLMSTELSGRMASVEELTPSILTRLTTTYSPSSVYSSSVPPTERVQRQCLMAIATADWSYVYAYARAYDKWLSLPFCSTPTTIFEELITVGRDDIALAIMHKYKIVCNMNTAMGGLGECAVKNNCLRAVPLLCTHFNARLSTVLVQLAAHRRMWPVIGQLASMSSADWLATDSSGRSIGHHLLQTCLRQAGVHSRITRATCSVKETVVENDWFTAITSVLSVLIENLGFAEIMGARDKHDLSGVHWLVAVRLLAWLCTTYGVTAVLSTTDCATNTATTYSIVHYCVARADVDMLKVIVDGVENEEVLAHQVSTSLLPQTAYTMETPPRRFTTPIAVCIARHFINQVLPVESAADDDQTQQMRAAFKCLCILLEHGATVSLLDWSTTVVNDVYDDKIAQVLMLHLPLTITEEMLRVFCNHVAECESLETMQDHLLNRTMIGDDQVEFLYLSAFAIFAAYSVAQTPSTTLLLRKSVTHAAQTRLFDSLRRLVDAVICVVYGTHTDTWPSPTRMSVDYTDTCRLGVACRPHDDDGGLVKADATCEPCGHRCICAQCVDKCALAACVWCSTKIDAFQLDDGTLVANTAVRQRRAKSTKGGKETGEDDDTMAAELTQAMDEKHSLDELITCAVCLDERLTVALCPCGHLACSTCAPLLEVCHICRVKVDSRMAVYFS